MPVRPLNFLQTMLIYNNLDVTGYLPLLSLFNLVTISVPPASHSEPATVDNEKKKRIDRMQIVAVYVVLRKTELRASSHVLATSCVCSVSMVRTWLAAFVQWYESTCSAWGGSRERERDSSCSARRFDKTTPPGARVAIENCATVRQATARAHRGTGRRECSPRHCCRHAATISRDKRTLKKRGERNFIQFVILP